MANQPQIHVGGDIGGYNDGEDIVGYNNGEDPANYIREWLSETPADKHATLCESVNDYMRDHPLVCSVSAYNIFIHSIARANGDYNAVVNVVAIAVVIPLEIRCHIEIHNIDLPNFARILREPRVEIDNESKDEYVRKIISGLGVGEPPYNEYDCLDDLLVEFMRNTDDKSMSAFYDYSMDRLKHDPNVRNSGYLTYVVSSISGVSYAVSLILDVGIDIDDLARLMTEARVGMDDTLDALDVLDTTNSPKCCTFECPNKCRIFKGGYFPTCSYVHLDMEYSYGYTNIKPECECGEDMIKMENLRKFKMNEPALYRCGKIMIKSAGKTG
jgi:hypothetical protein